MRKTYPLTLHQVAVLDSVKRDLEIAQAAFAAATAMAMAAAGVVPPCNFVGLANGEMVVETPSSTPENTAS